jgi:hypothetical protein
MKRHAAGHDRGGFRKHHSSVVEQNVRVSQACKFCAASKLKCDEDKPCQRCRDKDIVCEWAQDTATDALPLEQPEQQGTNILQSSRKCVAKYLLLSEDLIRLLKFPPAFEYQHDNHADMERSPAIEEMMDASIPSLPVQSHVSHVGDYPTPECSRLDLHSTEPCQLEDHMLAAPVSPLGGG